MKVGFLFGKGSSILSAWLFMIFAQIASGGFSILLGESWLYFSVFIPFTVTFTLLGLYFQKADSITNRKLWALSFISAFFVTLYSGTIGAISGEYVIRVLVQGQSYDWRFLSDEIFRWGIIYAVVLLPCTVPFARLLIGTLYRLMARP